MMSDRVAVVNRGRIEQLAPPDQLYERPATRFVADFIGKSNIIPVELHEEAGEAVAHCADGTRIPLGRSGIAGVAGGRSSARFLVVRPEKIRFDDGASGLDCRLEAVVEEAIYVGEATRFVLRVGENLRLIIKQPNRAGELTGAIGTRRQIGWASQDAVLVNK